MITWESQKRKVSDLIPASYNPRQMTEKQAKDLTTSLERFNLADPIVINIDNTIIGGHQRIAIYKLHGKNDVEIDVRVPSRKLTPEEEKELNLRLNKNLGEWDYDQLANFDEDMLKDVGFDSKELDKIFQLDDKPEADDVPDAWPVTDIKLGDVFTLGRHRVMCGDSTKHEDVERLMDGKKADMVFTDPPYGVGYEKKTKLLGNDDYTKINGDENLAQAEKIWQGAFENIGNVLAEGGSYYVCAPQGGDQMMMMMKNHIPCKHELMWIKPSPVFSMGRLDYDYQHEPILYGWKGSHKFIGQGEHTKSVWECGRDKGKLHPTMKPVALITNALLNSSERDGLCIDLFLGSGSTLIACEQTNRICYGMEIDPIYVQVIVDRWEKFTGQKAIKTV